MTVDGRPRPAVDVPAGPPPAAHVPAGPPPAAHVPAGPPPAADAPTTTATIRRGRHARPERRHEPPTPPTGHRPRHAVPETVTEELARVPAFGPATPVPVAAATPEAAAKRPLYGFEPDPDPDTPARERVRVVLAERRSLTRAVRTVAEIEQQTETGEFLLVNLVRAQLALAVRLVLVAVLVLGALPLLLVVVPGLTDVVVAGVRLPWLLLGVLPYPFLLALGRLYTHHAERNERDFADDAED